MDPNAALADIEWALTERWNIEKAERQYGSTAVGLESPDWNFIIERCRDLRQWLQSDGFQPDWTKYPSATATFKFFDCIF